MTVLPRSVGTFLIGRSAISRKRSPRSRMVVSASALTALRCPAGGGGGSAARAHRLHPLAQDHPVRLALLAQHHPHRLVGGRLHAARRRSPAGSAARAGRGRPAPPAAPRAAGRSPPARPSPPAPCARCNSTSSTSTTVRPSMLTGSSVGPISGLGRPRKTSSRYSVMSTAPSVRPALAGLGEQLHHALGQERAAGADADEVGVGPVCARRSRRPSAAAPGPCPPRPGSPPARRGPSRRAEACCGGHGRRSTPRGSSLEVVAQLGLGDEVPERGGAS